MTQTINFKIYQFGNEPDSEFEADGLLEGFDPDGDYDQGMAEELAVLLGMVRDSSNGEVYWDEEYQAGRLKNGHTAVVGLTLEGYRFSISEDATNSGGTREVS